VTLRVLLGDGGGPFRPAAFDVVLANISAPLLVERAAEIGGLAAPAGVLVLAGLLVTDIAAVQEAYAPWGTATVAQDGEWASLCVRRPAGP
jgi:ribosomal protein L11 methyltransferase